jgi:hypothetical protein
LQNRDPATLSIPHSEQRIGSPFNLTLLFYNSKLATDYQPMDGRFDRSEIGPIRQRPATGSLLGSLHFTRTDCQEPVSSLYIAGHFMHRVTFVVWPAPAFVGVHFFPTSSIEMMLKATHRFASEKPAFALDTAGKNLRFKGLHGMRA